ncbi:transposase [Algoriphagus machipongonensis]|uniref:Transposase n=1 Tax=Algoriphagus machipongonensis TaxID=388413 RepID=A3HWB8_9BACT|nr:transposase [Algoriphagus machipongonensis]EAZ80891.1 transposase [Algoriphagus machipongonensis]
MELNKVYFFTSTIRNWIPFLKSDFRKDIIISSLKHLSDKNCIKVYGFVVMPNHIHLIIECLKLNGKEMPHASFLKFTGHECLKLIRANSYTILEKFRVKSTKKNYEFWKEDSMKIELYSPEIAIQKLDYIHNNPCQKKWMLSEDPISYDYSSFQFYETGKDRFGFLNNISERIF